MVILTALLIFGFAVSFSSAADDTSARAQTMRQTGKQILEVGYEQYRRGMYDDAKATLEKAAAYRQYLSVSDASKLDELLKQLSTQPTAPVSQPEPVAVAEQKIEPPVIIEPPIQTQQTDVDSEYIEFIPVGETDINQVSQTQTPVQVQVYPEFVTPAPQDEIDYVIIDADKLNQKPIQPQPQAAPAPQEQEKESYIEVVKQKQRIQQSYTKAVVSEAVAKAKEYADKEDFAKARDEISRASAVVEKNKLLLGDTDYRQYTADLQQLMSEIEARRSTIESQKTEKARTEAKLSQEALRAQQAADKQQRIQNLLAHAAEYQEQQRYDEALAEIETLLAIDPLHRDALRSKRMLEDIINLRTQLEIKREIGRQEEAVFADTQKSMIPHAELYTLPRNWQDIVAKRKPSVITGRSPADIAVDEQLKTLVDLTALTPDTPLNEAIEIIRVSVDPPLKIMVRWRDLDENAYIEQDTVIGIQGMVGIPLKKALKELLDTVSGGIANIDYIVEEGIITIATRASLPTKLITHVYDITELVGRPAQFETDLAISTTGVESGGGGGEAATESAIVQQTPELVILMIQETVEPLSWLINGGEGTVSAHGTKLVISQTPQIHEQIQKLLLEDLRESLGQQVSLETRFLFVTENFLEDIGFGISRITAPSGTLFGRPYTFMDFQFGHGSNVTPTDTTIEGSLAENVAATAVSLVGGVQYGSVLDDLTLSFFLRAVQSHRDAKVLTAPRVTVLSGESAYIRVVKETSYIADYEFEDITAQFEGAPTRIIANVTRELIAGGVVLNVTPTISADKKYVTLLIGTNYTRADLAPDFIFSAETGDAFPISLPTSQISEIQTRVNVPDGGTLLIGGQKLAAEVNRESGVPGLSKIPVIGRLFSSRSQVKDQDVLLVLVKPTIILQQEAEREYFAPLE
jgi:tetratricopeptide (TPR) repeat protein